MDVVYRLNDIAFVWDSEKALANLQKHGVALEMACGLHFPRGLHPHHLRPACDLPREKSL